MSLVTSCGVPEAVELYEKALHAFVTNVGDIVSYGKEALKLDKGFVLVHCMLGTMWLGSLKSPTSSEVAPHVEAVKEAGSGVTERERAHIRAFLSFASGNLPGALKEWSDILIHYPTDALALRFHFNFCIIMGDFERQRDALSSALPFWAKDHEFYPHLLGFYCFALQANNQFEKGEEVGSKAISLNKDAIWAYHGISHVIEEEHGPETGVEFLTSTRENWTNAGLAGHIAWHLTLYYLDLGNTEAVLQEYDTILSAHCNSEDLLGLLDASSLLWRMTIMGLDPGEERWKRVADGFSGFSIVVGSSFLQTHLMMSLAHGKVTECTARLALAREMLKAFEEYSRQDTSHDCKISNIVGVPLCDALLAYGKEDYSEVVSLMLPLRYDFVRLGGSWAQRQVYSVTLIQAAIKSNQIPLALALVSELRAIKPNNKWLAKTFDELMKKHKTIKATV